MSNFAPTWTDERIKKLKGLAAAPERWSASEIAARLGSVSRNAVIGKLHRLGLVGTVKTKPGPKPLGQARPRGGLQVFNLQRAKDLKPATPRPDLGIVVDNVTDLPPDQSEFACTIVDLSSCMCRFPLGIPAGDMKYCGAQCIGSWCSRHAAIVFQPSHRARQE